MLKFLFLSNLFDVFINSSTTLLTHASLIDSVFDP